jgi:hypothetical protein
MVYGTVAIKKTIWPQYLLKKALKMAGIRCSIEKYHHCTFGFADEQEAIQFGAACVAQGVKFGEGHHVPRFRLLPSEPLDPSTVAGLCLDGLGQGWTAKKQYAGVDFNLGEFDNREAAVEACAMFNRLVSLIEVE